MDRLNHVNLWWIFPRLIAAGAVGGGAFEATSCLITWTRGRRT